MKIGTLLAIQFILDIMNNFSSQNFPLLLISSTVADLNIFFSPSTIHFLKNPDTELLC